MAGSLRYEIVIVDASSADHFGYENAITNGYYRNLEEVNDVEFTVVETKEKDQMYYTKKVKSPLEVAGSDFQYLYDRIDSCEKYWMNVYKRCEDGVERHVHRCFFNQLNIEYDLDSCVATIELQDSPIYECIRTNRGRKFNLFDYYTPTAQVQFYLGAPEVYRTMDFFYAVVAAISEMSCCSESACYVYTISEFFEWSHDILTDTYTIPLVQPTSNYANALAGYWPHISAKDDVKDPFASNPATVLEISFEDVETVMREIFNVYWIIEDPKYIRWEHYSWFARNVNYDATSATNFPLNKKKNKIKIDKQDFPTTEKFLSMEAGSEDFIGMPIEYPSDCSNGSTKERGTPQCTVDVEYIQNNPEKIDSLGFVLWDIVEIFPGTPLAPYFPVYATGYLSGAAFHNNRLSWGNVLFDLHLHGRPTTSGRINGNTETFLSPVYKKIQEDIIVENCCEDEFQKHESLVRTEIGDGAVEEAEINYNLGQITFKVKHE